MKVAVVDYGIGNIFSVMAALRALKVDYIHDTHGTSISNADVALVPGVAAFQAGLDLIRASGQADELAVHHRAGKPLIGLCLGAQMFLGRSEEDSGAEGLGFVEGQVIALEEGRCRVPNQGWLRTRPLRDGESHWSPVVGEPYFYYSHSFRMVVANPEMEVAWATAEAETILAVYRHENVTGVQFHPERSGKEGLSFLDRLLNSIG